MLRTLFPVIRGPGKTPFATTAAREKPSGETSALEMVRSVTGPIAAETRPKEWMTAVSAQRDENLPMINCEKEWASELGGRLEALEGEEEKRLVSDESPTDEHPYICLYSFLRESYSWTAL